MAGPSPARVAYVRYDQVVVGHAQALQAGGCDAMVIEADSDGSR